jgi:preprotein translocase subunit SecF
MKTYIPFIRYSHFFAVVSLVAVVLSIYVLSVKGLNFDTDFKGGRKLLYQFSTSVDETEIRSALSEGNLKDFTVFHYGDAEGHRYMIQTSVLDVEGKEDPIKATMNKAFAEKNISLQQEESVGPKAGKELRSNAQKALLISCLVILIYVGFRFDFKFAPGAVVALIHDVVITLGAISFVQSSFSLTSVAALLTILGYSINDTIVLYDRVRENLEDVVNEAMPDVVNQSINHVMSRTLLTSITVLFVVLVLYFVAEGAIREFAFAMIIGTVAGTYSSIFVASPVYLWVQGHGAGIAKVIGLKK